MANLQYLILGVVCFFNAHGEISDHTNFMQVVMNASHVAASGQGDPGAAVKEMMGVLAKVPLGTSPGFRSRVVDAIPKAKAECPTQKYVTGNDCNRTVQLMNILTQITNGPEPPKTWQTKIRYMLGLHYFLYVPGSMICFQVLDKDASQGISWDEFLAVFGADMMSSMEPIFKFMDTSEGPTNGDGVISRKELHSFLRAAIIIRSILPEIDAIDPGADTSKCLAMAHRIVVVPKNTGKPLGKYTKLLCIAGIMFGTVLFHCLFCTGSWTSKYLQ